MPTDMRERGVKAIGACAAILLGAAVALMAAQVVLRFGFNRPQAWAEEVDRYLFVWSVYLGAVIAVIRDTHIRVTVLVDPAGPRAKRLSDVLNRWISAGCFAFVGYYAYLNAWQYRDAGFYTIPSLPQVIFYLSVPVGMTLMLVYLLLPTRR